MRAPNINLNSAPQRTNLEQALTSQKSSAQQGRSLELQGGFSEVFNLVKPTEPAPVREDKTAEEPRELQGREEVARERDLTTRETDQKVSEARSNDMRGAERVDQAKQVDVEQAKPVSDSDAISRAEALRLVQQLSQEDLLKLVELQQGAELGLNPELTPLESEALPAIKALSTSELMALLNGFQDAKQPLNLAQQLETSVGAQQLPEHMLSHTGHAQTQALQLNTQQLNTQAQQPQLNPAVVTANMQSVVRPQEVMPALNQVKLSETQREGIVRQVANAFRAKGGGTQTTEIRLHPEELGLVRLKVEMRGSDVRVFFSAENPAVMELLSNNIDQLKALLLEQDFNLSEAGVWQDFGAQDQGGAEQGAEGEDYGSDERPDLRHRPKSGPRMSPLPGRFRATI